MTKYISKAINTPIKSKIFNALPTPKYLNIKINVIAKEKSNPRLVFDSKSDMVKKTAVNTTRKKRGRANRVSGLTKNMIANTKTQQIMEIMSRGRKFFLFFISNLLLSFTSYCTMYYRWTQLFY